MNTKTNNSKKDFSETVGPKLSLTVDEAAYLAGVSRTQMFELIRSGEVDSFLLGPQTRRVTRASVEAMIKRKAAEQMAAKAALPGDAA
jgi:excisionase family DNA binding protein